MSNRQPRPDQIHDPAPFNGAPSDLDQWFAKHGNGPRYELLAGDTWYDHALVGYRGQKTAGTLTDPLPDAVITQAEADLAAFNAHDPPEPIKQLPNAPAGAVDVGQSSAAAPATSAAWTPGAAPNPAPPAILPIPAANAPVEHHISFWSSVKSFMGHAASVTGHSLTNPAVIAVIGTFVPAKFQPEVAIAEGIAEAVRDPNAAPASLMQQ